VLKFFRSPFYWTCVLVFALFFYWREWNDMLAVMDLQPDLVVRLIIFSAVSANIGAAMAFLISALISRRFGTSRDQY
jgi:hypothetical protein